MKNRTEVFYVWTDVRKDSITDPAALAEGVWVPAQMRRLTG